MPRAIWFISLYLVLFTALSLHAQQSARELVDVQRLGPQIGDKVPDFTLQDQNGKTWTLRSIMGRNGAVLVFLRSADWCPYCRTQLAELQGRVEELKAQGRGLAAISYDPPIILADFTRKRGITFPLLSDPGSTTIKTYGILNTTVAATSTNYGIPFPGTFLLNRQGIVISRYFEDAYQERNSVSSILLRLGGIATEAATQLTTNQVTITQHASDSVVAPGTVFSLVLDIAPKERVHLYAPGATDYQVVTLNVAPDPVLKLRPMRFPASEIYYFAPLKERVPVYQKPFRLVQEVSLDASEDGQALLRQTDTVTIKATLDYQACDDKVCFPPTSTPLSWRVRVRQLDTESANVAR